MVGNLNRERMKKIWGKKEKREGGGREKWGRKELEIKEKWEEYEKVKDWLMETLFLAPPL
jgi:hypothetical protein